MRPKLFARIVRFESALEYKARFDTKLWTEVAHTFGYYDQMHMVHDFADLGGSTPLETLHQLQTVSCGSRSSPCGRADHCLRQVVLYGSSSENSSFPPAPNPVAPGVRSKHTRLKAFILGGSLLGAML